MPIYDIDRLDREFRYNLRRCSKLSDAQFRLLGLIATYKHGCLLQYADICALTDWSRAKAARIVSELVSLGLVERTYRCGKRMCLMIVCAAEQIAFAKQYGNEGRLTGETSGHLTHETVTSHRRDHDVSPMRRPMLERELERKLESSFEFPGGTKEVPKQPGDVMKLVGAMVRANRKPGVD